MVVSFELGRVFSAHDLSERLEEEGWIRYWEVLLARYCFFENYSFATIYLVL